MRLPMHDRYDYIPLPDRPVYDWPGGKRLAVAICNNIEVFAFLKGLGSDGAQVGAPQTTRNFAWRDYGNRVGQWYLFDLLDELELPASHNLNSLLVEECPQIIARIKARGDEVVAHGRTNAERQDGLFEADEARLIRETTEGLTEAFGVRPDGWLGPYLAQSPVTLDLLKEDGYGYVMDWPADDQPFWMRTRAGPILSVPVLDRDQRQPGDGFPPARCSGLRSHDHRSVRRDAVAVPEVAFGLHCGHPSLRDRPALPAPRVAAGVEPYPATSGRGLADHPR